MDAYELARVANIVLSVVLLAACNYRLTRDWSEWTRREKVVRVHLTAYLAIIAYGTAEQMANDVKPGFRVLLILVTHLSFAAAMWRNRKDPR